MPSPIQRVAVLGAGTMGAAIAAHAANAGLAVDLLDVAAEGADRNQVATAGFERMLAARPPALYSSRLARQIRLGNLSDDLERAADADWVVEAIIEQLEPKQELAAKLEKLVRPTAIVSSNTSGIPLRSIAEGLGEDFRRRFLGTHFFNPPRYLKLLELVPTADTDPEVIERMRHFGERVLGKGVVIAKDTPNFIGNRLGTFLWSQSVRYALANGYTIEEVDALTGPLLGRPKTGTFRLADQVGLDVMLSVNDNLVRLAPEDESLAELDAPEEIRRMRTAGLLGNKTGAGFYRRGKRDGETVFDVLDLETLEHRPARDPHLPIVEQASERRRLGERLAFLLDRAESDRGARFVRDTLLPGLGYAARRLPEIADSPAEVDHAVEWGFGHEAGPFRTWDLLGVRATADRLDALGIEVAPWLRRLLDDGNERIYTTAPDGGELVYSPVAGAYEPVAVDPEILDLAACKAAGGEVAGNRAASLVDLGDGVLCFELHSRANAISSEAIEIGRRALELLGSGEWAGLVVGNAGRNFCVGADLGEIGMAAYEDRAEQLDGAVRALQELLMGLRFAPVPVVTAPHGQTLGGGAEIAMAGDEMVMAGETYIGLVETGVGLVPAGGGIKELLRRLVSPALATPGEAPLPVLQRVFEMVATAKVAGSAVEARELGYLGPDDSIVLHPDHLLSAAKRRVLALAPGYRPPLREDRSIYAAGRPLLAALELAVTTMRWGGYASEYDTVVANHLAKALCGGEAPEAAWVTEDDILALEREAFLALCARRETLERIQAMLTTGKPLRN